MSSYILEVRDEKGNSVFSHDMDYENGKLKFVPSGKAIKDAIKAAEKKEEDDMPEYQKTHNAAMEPIDAAIDAGIKAKGQKRFMIYSVYSNYDNPENNLKEIAVEGLVRFIHEGTETFGNGSGWKSEILENPTWLDVAVLSNEMMLITSDYHHCFLEGVYKHGDGEVRIGAKGEDDEVVQEYKISMGS